MDIAQAIAIIGTGRYPAGIYSDPELFELERSRLFARTWQFLAHESEIANPGDFVVRRIVDDSFLVTRDRAGRVNVLLNMCRHRGMQVCRSEAGNTTTFRCPYHAWTYGSDGRLLGVPFHEEAYGGDAGLDKATHGLVPAPRASTCRGLIFANLNPDAAPLEDAMGDFGFFLDFYVHQSEDGVELRGPQRWRVRCNWKIAAENFSGDSYHTPQTHASVVDIGLFREPTGTKRKEGALYFAGGGGGTTYKLPAADFAANLSYIGYPPEMVERMRRTWTPAQQAMIADARFMVSAATAFPNLSFVHNWPKIRPGHDVVPFISLRLWRPVSATETECYSWFAVDRNAPAGFKADSLRAYLMCFGTSGMFEQDDVENWTSITGVARGHFASQIELDSTMGLAAENHDLGTTPDPWPAPGTAHVGYGEYNQRAFLRLWADQLSSASSARRGRPAGMAPLAGR